MTQTLQDILPDVQARARSLGGFLTVNIGVVDNWECIYTYVREDHAENGEKLKAEFADTRIHVEVGPGPVPAEHSGAEAVIMNVGAYGESLFLRPHGKGFVFVWEQPNGKRQEIRLTRGHTEVLRDVTDAMLKDPHKALEQWGWGDE